ncbi:MAG: hypothetical protein HDR28_08800 [Lachnospiraceae bacterium]|nr:hypothetical protein [Lachnospiraceae bacterium]
MKKNLSLLMAVLLGLAWYVTISSWVGNDSKYQDYIAEAERLEEKELYLDAIDAYESAKELKPDNLEVEERIADIYFAMGNHKEYRRQLDAIIDKYGPVEADVTKAYEFYRDYSSEDSLINYVAKLYEEYPDSTLVKEYYNLIKGIYTEMYMSYDDIGTFFGKTATYEQGGKKGLLNVDGNIVVEAVYDDIIYNGTDADRITVKDGSKYYFINNNGYKTKEPEEAFDYLGMFSSKRIVARKEGKYGYLDSSLKEKLGFIYDEASAFREDIAAVKKDDKWALINTKGEELTEYVYDDVALNSGGYCSVNSVVWVKQGSEWFLIDKTGERIGENTYQDVKAFESSQPCAVCRNEMWGFADTAGNMVIDGMYQDAKSYANGFAPVKNNGLWGYIDLENYLAVEFAFGDARQMTAGGVAPIAHGNKWTLIELKAIN